MAVLFGGHFSAVLRGCHPIAGQKGAVKGLLAFKAGILPDIRDIVVRFPKEPGGVIQPQTVYVFMEAAMELSGKYPGNIVFVEMQLPGNPLKGQ